MTVDRRRFGAVAGRARSKGEFEEWVSIGDLTAGLHFRVKIAEISGLPQIVGLCVESLIPSDTSITSEVVRRLPLRQLRSAAVAATRGDSDWLSELLETPPGGPIRRPDAHYQDVARVYRDHVADAPLKQVQETFGVSRAAASKKVRRARELGFLGWPAKAGMPGSSETASPYAKSGLQTSKRRGR